ncbi:hypothetical protein RJ639_023534 [Escallonia herrerae]|uniref:VDE lipocalin domain-containing protein n=1 Tax=Escallonia herrerae TaxID=1293975 RepID=A0AA89AEG4_9ASTE|nr:hypothetical protein RJ639_023534 [Escallonia herrerae]
MDLINAAPLALVKSKAGFSLNRRSIKQTCFPPQHCCEITRSRDLKAKKLKWVDDGLEMLVFSDSICQSDGEAVDNLQREVSKANILVIVAVTNKESVKWVHANSRNIANIICFESSPVLRNKLGGSFIEKETKGSIFSNLPGVSQSKKMKKSVEIVQTVSDAWDRHKSDDIRFCVLVIVNAYLRPVSILKNLRAQGFSTLNCMVKNCGPQILNCLLDPNCRKALQCLNQCSPVDQVCNYRCIASYESPTLEEFSLCVLQKNNCLGLDAKIPEKPYVPPMVKFRGEDLSHQMAEDLFVGWLGSLDWSWRVVAGQKPAYDQFPCQYQLFYRGKAKGSLWYEPIFQVKTLEGKLVWRRRKYRVKRGKVPGHLTSASWTMGWFRTSFGQLWTFLMILAGSSGKSYTGAVLVSPDGDYPSEREHQRLVSALDRCYIKEWELFAVDNCSCEDPPLGLPEGSSLHRNVEVKDLT